MHHARFDLSSFSFAFTCVVRIIFQIVGTPYTRNAVRSSHSFDQIRDTASSGSVDMAGYLLLSQLLFLLPLLTCTTKDDH